MKKFFRSFAGKAVIFILCVISLCLFLCSAAAIFLYGEEGFYNKSKQTLEDDIVFPQVRMSLFNRTWEASYLEGDLPQIIEDDGNLVFSISDEQGNVILCSKSASSIKNWDYNVPIRVVFEDGHPADYYLDENTEPVDNTVLYYGNASIVLKNGVIDFYSLEAKYFDTVYDLRFMVFWIAGISLITAVVTFLILMANAGKRNEDEEIHEGPLYRIPFDLLLCMSFALFLVFAFAITEGSGDLVQIALAAFGMVFFISIGLGLCVSMAARIRKKTLIKGSFLYFICEKIIQLLKTIWKYTVILIKGIPLVWKILIPFGFLSSIEINDLHQGSGFFWFLSKLFTVLFITYLGLCMSKLLKAGDALAKGDLSYQTDTSKMIFDLKQHGEDLNSIAIGMSRAVDERMKSERMKTELITNVSHDIKTPLTSIINYSDLISNEETDNEKIIEYAGVLNRQSQRLKRLLEDLVEVSKANSGNLEVNLAPCDAAMFISQAAGEYEERFTKADLTLISSAPDHEVMILADPRRMWRIFDNLMNNISKYAQEGTRVYLDLKEENGNANIIFRNTSRDPLNISAEELMERFTRGDSSRNSEGNGLGLSIAQSLCELQKGKMDVSVDGDLFKVTLSFPVL